MTREEALQILDTIPTIGEQVDALEMAIQALSQEPCDTYTEGYFKGYDDGLEQKLEEPCDDVVSREAVKNEIKCWIGSCEYRYAMSERFLFDRINNLPSVTPSRRKGNWIDKTEWYECSECGESHSYCHKFCPYCGAEMESEDKECI